MQVTVNIEYETSTTFTDGYVMATDPAAGETLTAGQTVTLTVCAGAGVELVKVPALQGETVDEAIADIKDAGLEPGQVRYVESDLPKDTVTYQSVDAGEQVKAGTVINLQASKGPEQARTPFVRSVSQDAEIGLNEELTLRVEAETERQRHAELCVVRVGERERRRREPRLAQRGGQRQLHRGHEPDGHVLLFL